MFIRVFFSEYKLIFRHGFYHKHCMYLSPGLYRLLFNPLPPSDVVWQQKHLF